MLELRRIWKRLKFRHLYTLLFVSALLGNTTKAQESLYSLGVTGSYTNSSRLYNKPDASDEISRNQYLSLDGIFGVGFDVRRTFSESRIEIGLAVEYLRKIENFSSRYGALSIPSQTGYWTLPIELSGYFIIPFSTVDLRLYIGGGAGVYIGQRTYSIAGQSAETISSKPGFGIHVVTGMEYNILPWFGIRSEVKFRDLQFESTHQFTSPSVVYQGVTVPLSQAPARSRVNVDGMLLDAGIVVRF